MLLSEPLPGGRAVRGTERRPRAEGAEARRELSERCSPAAARMPLVRDHRHTPGPASF